MAGVLRLPSLRPGRSVAAACFYVRARLVCQFCLVRFDVSLRPEALMCKAVTVRSRHGVEIGNVLCAGVQKRVQIVLGEVLAFSSTDGRSKKENTGSTDQTCR